MTKTLFKLGLVASLVVFLLSCEADNLKVDKPGYLTIDSFQVNYINPDVTGIGGTKITDAWVFLDGDLLSVMPLPGEIPIPELGNHNLTIGPGIRVNGIAATRDEYPFYNRIDTNLNINGEESIRLNPVLTYTDAATFAFIEDFEQSAISIDSAPVSEISPTRVALNSTSHAYGNFVGYGALDSSKTDMKFTFGPLELPKGGVPVYMELDYKTNALMIIGIRYDGATGGVEYAYSYLNATDRETGIPQWNKVYIELTREISGILDATEIGFSINGAYESNDSVSEFYFDNIKIVHR